MCSCLSHTPSGDLALNPGMCPDWESNWWPFGLQAVLNPLPGLLSLFFVSPLPQWQNVSLWGLFFIQGNKQTNKKRRSGRDQVNRESGAQESHCLLVKNCWTLSMVWASALAYKSPIMKRANAFKESSKKFADAEHSLSAHRELVHWYRWVPRTHLVG